MLNPSHSLLSFDFCWALLAVGCLPTASHICCRRSVASPHQNRTHSLPYKSPTWPTYSPPPHTHAHTQALHLAEARGKAINAAPHSWNDPTLHTGLCLLAGIVAFLALEKVCTAAVRWMTQGCIRSNMAIAACAHKPPTPFSAMPPPASLLSPSNRQAAAHVILEPSPLPQPMPPSPRRKNAKFWAADAAVEQSAPADEQGPAPPASAGRRTRSAVKAARESLGEDTGSSSSPASETGRRRTASTQGASANAPPPHAAAASEEEAERTKRPMALLSILVNSLDNLAHGVAIAASYNLSLRVRHRSVGPTPC